MKSLVEVFKKLIKNKIVIYLFTRYFTYFLQFITSVIIAIKLGPYYFGIWGFLLLLINYFYITNFGISNAANILLVQHKDNGERVKNLVLTAFLCVGGIAALILLCALYYWIFGISFFEKYSVGSLFYIVCIIAILSHFNVLLMTIYRVRNRLVELAYFQSSIPALVFIATILTDGQMLLYSLLGAYLIGNISSIIVFYAGKKVPWGGEPNKSDAKVLIKKGSFLFIYNICFYLIIVSIKSIISFFYSVEEFGLFSFSYSLSNAILLFLQALTFIVFPKVIDKLNSRNNKTVEGLIRDIRVSYVSMAFGMVFLALIIFPFFLEFIPAFKEAIVTLELTALTVVLYTNSFGYGTYLMAQNKEKIVAKISSLCLFVNVAIALTLVMIFKVDYVYVIFSTMISYSLYAYLCVHFGRDILSKKSNITNNLKECFPLRLLVPYILALLIIVSRAEFLLPIPFIVYVFLNWRALKAIGDKVKNIINRPDVINL